MLKNWWHVTGASSGGIGVVPAGLIMPFNDLTENVPSGWEQLTGGIFSGSLPIKGATSAPSAGGSDIVTLGSNSTGAHAGTHNRAMLAYGADGSYNVNFPTIINWAVAAHSHSLDFDYKIKSDLFVFVKNLAETAKLPGGVAVLSDIDLSTGLSDITPVGSTLGITTTGTKIERTAELSSGDSSLNGEHFHFHDPRESPGCASSAGYYQGSGNSLHKHTSTPSLTNEAVKRCWLGMWSSLSDYYIGDGVIGMWEDPTTIPDKWSICNGTNGTPDLTDTFIGLDSSKLGQVSGDNTIELSATLNSGGAHYHGIATVTNCQTQSPHNTENAHTHTISGSAAYIPEHYTLLFIKFTG